MYFPEVPFPLSQAALAFEEGQRGFAIPLENGYFVLVVFTLEMVSGPCGSFVRNAASNQALSSLAGLCSNNHISGAVSCSMLRF